MKLKKLSIILLFLIQSIFLFANGLEVPLCDESEIIDHGWYKLKYNELYEQADWAAYELTKEELEGNSARRDRFRADEMIESGSAELSDYKGSGYDRGHLVPAGDLKISKESMDSSFVLSNISPQIPAFNRGIWLELENYVRTWAWEYGSVYITTGPIFSKPEIKTIGKNKVGVPDYFYKVVLDYKSDPKKAAGFILPNTNLEQAVSDFIVSIV